MYNGIMNNLKGLVYVLVALVLLLTITAAAHAFSVTLAWDPNSEEDLAGYKIFCRQEGQSYDYKASAWEGTETTCTIPELTNGAVYYFVARALDTVGNESGDSNEVKVEIVPPKAPCLLRWLR